MRLCTLIVNIFYIRLLPSTRRRSPSTHAYFIETRRARCLCVRLCAECLAHRHTRSTHIGALANDVTDDAAAASATAAAAADQLNSAICSSILINCAAQLFARARRTLRLELWPQPGAPAGAQVRARERASAQFIDIDILGGRPARSGPVRFGSKFPAPA